MLALDRQLWSMIRPPQDTALPEGNRSGARAPKDGPVKKTILLQVGDVLRQ